MVEEVAEATEGRPYVVLLRRSVSRSTSASEEADQHPRRSHNVKRLSQSLATGEGLDDQLLLRLLGAQDEEEEDEEEEKEEEKRVAEERVASAHVTPPSTNSVHAQ